MPLGISSAAAVRVGHALGREPIPRTLRGPVGPGLRFGGILMSVRRADHLIPACDRAAVHAGSEHRRRGHAACCASRHSFNSLTAAKWWSPGACGEQATPARRCFATCRLLGDRLPLGALLCFRYGFGAAGLWMGLSLGLILIGIVLVELWRQCRAIYGMRYNRWDGTMTVSSESAR